MHQICFDLYVLQLFQVTHLSFYDVLLDFVLLDAFDDLETPPYSVATAVQNRWLSARIKETVSIRVTLQSFILIRLLLLGNFYPSVCHTIHQRTVVM